MLTYTVDGSILTIVGTGTTPDDERALFYASVRADPRVPDRALLLLDARPADPVINVRELEARAQLIALALGRKMGPLCAIVTPRDFSIDAEHFQAAGGALGVRVGIFTEAAAARSWLSAFAQQ